jgi:hypothetical protein
MEFCFLSVAFLILSVAVICGLIFSEHKEFAAMSGIVLILFGYVGVGLNSTVKTHTWEEYLFVSGDQFGVSLVRDDKELVRYTKKQNLFQYSYYQKYSGDFFLVKVSRDYNVYGMAKSDTIEPTEEKL